MTTLCLGALLTGMAAAWMIPFLPFACAVLVAVVLGSAWAGLGGAPAGSTALSASMLLVACQIGYGAGLVLAALVGQAMPSRRAAREEPSPSSSKPVRTGDGSR